MLSIAKYSYAPQIHYLPEFEFVSLPKVNSRGSGAKIPLILQTGLLQIAARTSGTYIPLEDKIAANDFYL